MLLIITKKLILHNQFVSTPGDFVITDYNADIWKLFVNQRTERWFLSADNCLYSDRFGEFSDFKNKFGNVFGGVSLVVCLVQWNSPDFTTITMHE